jgi:AhpD family alkylhydroperoxidase
MTPRLNSYAIFPDLIEPLVALDKSVKASGLEHSLIELVNIRASQINGCAYCLYVHTQQARTAGESEERLHLLNAWRDSPLYSERERAALAWTEALTLVSKTHAPDDVYQDLHVHFSDEEKVKLTVMIVTINAWNRIAIGFRSVHPAQPWRQAA